jgi:hypothetical protein
MLDSQGAAAAQSAPANAESATEGSGMIDLKAADAVDAGPFRPHP